FALSIAKILERFINLVPLKYSIAKAKHISDNLGFRSSLLSCGTRDAVKLQ
ncbi:21212_t:CDS:1, partial [Gigaspora margarita]